MMKLTTTVAMAVAIPVLLTLISPISAPAADSPADQILAMYFHRTERCPTCLKMGSYSEEAVKSGFAKQVESGTVAFYYVDFQDEKNAKLAKGYGISGPALIIARIADGKVAEFKDLEEIWDHVAEKETFLNHVQENVAAYLD